MRNCIKSGSKGLCTNDKQGKIGEADGRYPLAVIDILLFRSAYILKIVIPVFGMQADAAVNLIGASGQLHDDNRTVFACQFLYLFCRSNAGYHRQPLFLAGHMEPAQCAGGNEGGDTGDVLHGDAVCLQFVIYIMYGRVESGIAFGNDTDLLSLLPEGGALHIDLVVGAQGFFALFAHGEWKAVHRVFRNGELQ